MYKLFIKRLLDILFSGIAIIILSPIMLIISILVFFKLGCPVIFVQRRPGKNMIIHKYHKFRSMTDKKDENGNFLPDEDRLTPFGRKLRSTSLDELPQLFDIFVGKMSIVGPRPQTIENIMFMSEKQKKRQSITPGLTGWAQVNGRNNTTWDERVEFDLEYIKRQSFSMDCLIIWKTIKLVSGHSDINQDGEYAATFETMGKYLLRTNQINEEQYFSKKREIKQNYNTR